MIKAWYKTIGFEITDYQWMGEKRIEDAEQDGDSET